MLSPKTVEIVKQITPAVAANAETITRRFYVRMFEENPEVQAFFNQAHQHTGGQQRALAGAICAYFSHIDNPAALGQAVELIAHKHCSLGIQAEHYPIVGKHLLAAIKDVMGDAATDEILQAVAEAYQFLAGVFIGRESEMYAEQAAAPGGWNGYRPMTVARKVRESEIITSFYLQPADGGSLAAFKAGQYLTVRIDHPQIATSPRNYSLSDRPGLDHYRISVKRESALHPGAADGVVSTYLHEDVQVGDTLEIGPACGEFVLAPETTADRPVIFLAGGVGITPLLSMAKTLVHQRHAGPIYFLQAARNGAVRAFGDELRELVDAAPDMRLLTLFNQPSEWDLSHGLCDRKGTLDTEILREFLGDVEDADVYFCGPKPFMARALTSLRELGIAEERIRFEYFGPRQELESGVAAVA